MKKKATLLIQHLETIYTMIPPSYPCIHHGFIAVHHDCILAIGEGEGWIWVDKDTRIIEGRAHICIPALIDVALHLPLVHHLAPKTDITLYKKANMIHDLARHTRENCEVMMKHGTLLGNLIRVEDEVEEQIIEQFAKPYEFDFVSKEVSSSYPIIKPLQKIPSKRYRRFCISSGYEFGVIDCLDQFLCAKLYYQYSQEDPMQVLAACTIHPARALGIPRLGSLQVGKLANMIMLEGQNFEQVLRCFHTCERMQIIKEGTRIYPNVII